MKVLHFFVRFPHPYQPYNALLLERQKQSGMDCSVFSFYADGTKKSNKNIRIACHFLAGLTKMSLVSAFHAKSHKSLFQSIIFIGRLKQVIHRKPDLIHVHHVQMLTNDYRIFFSLLNTPCVLSLRGSDSLVKPLRNHAAKEFFASALHFVDGIHTVSGHLALTALHYVGVNRKTFVIRRTPDSVNAINRNVSFETEHIILTAIGRLNWTKGFTYLLQAVQLLKEKGYHVSLNLIGDSDENERSEMLYWIELLQITNNINMVGYINSDRINSILEETHIYIQPSISEGIPNTLIRAIANKIPVIASRVGGIPEIVNDDHGILVPPGDYKSIAEGVIKIITDKLFRANLFQKKSDVDFDPQREMDEYRTFYKQTLENFNQRNS